MGNGESRPRRLLLDGGGELPQGAMDIFKGWAKQHFDECGINTSALCTILIIPWASERELHEHLEDANQWIFEKDDIKIQVAHGVSQISENHDVLDSCLQLIENANAVFFTGGDQSRIMNLLEARPKLHKALSRRYNEGCGFAGTSAGTAVMSGTMITGDGGSEGGSVPWDFISAGSRVVTRPGLGFAKNIVVDQHFTRRGRFNRLVSVLLDEQTPERFGLGVDEDLAVVIEDKNLRVFSSRPGLMAVLLKKRDDGTEPDESQPSRFELTLLPSNGKVFVLE